MSLQPEAQNIIVNGSFEELIACPESPGGLGYAQPWGTGAGSPDLMNLCGLYEWGIPVNRGGGQWPRTGDGYASIATYSTTFIEAREILWQPIKYQLVAGEKYYFEMYLSHRDSFQYATHNIAVVFEDTMLGGASDLDCLFECLPVIENTSSNPLINKTDWMKISGTFIAQGNEKFIHIGNVRNDATTEVEFIGGGSNHGQFNWGDAAYYVDDIWLSHIDSAGYVSVSEELSMNNYELEVYPNPASNQLTIDFSIKPPAGRSLEVTLTDMLGRASSPPWEEGLGEVIELNISQLPNGVYLLSVQTEDGGQLTQRLVVQH